MSGGMRLDRRWRVRAAHAVRNEWREQRPGDKMASVIVILTVIGCIILFSLGMAGLAT